MTQVDQKKQGSKAPSIGKEKQKPSPTVEFKCSQCYRVVRITQHYGPAVLQCYTCGRHMNWTRVDYNQ